MRNRFFLTLGVALAIGFLALDAEGRGGGGGRGGRAGGFGGGFNGGARAGNLGGNVGGQGGIRNGAGNIGQGGFNGSGGKLQSIANGGFGKNLNGNVQNNFQNRTSQLKTNFAAGNQPFTGSWYGNHPNAWQYSHPRANAWAVASLAEAGAWLGLAAIDDEESSIYTGETSTTDEEETGEETDPNAAAVAAGGPQGIGDYLPLGVFAIAPPGEQNANALVQLAVSKQGEIRGNYYDVLSGQEQPITGTLDKATQRATFKAANGNVTFETTLANLTQRNGAITLNFSGGPSKQWTLARYDETASQNNATQPRATQTK